MLFLNSGTAAGAVAGDIYRCHKKFYIKSKRGGKLAWMDDGTLANCPVGIMMSPTTTTTLSRPMYAVGALILIRCTSGTLQVF